MKNIDIKDKKNKNVNYLILLLKENILMQLVFATNNLHKISEVKVLLPSSVKLLSLTDINCDKEIPETAETIEGNALLKAQFVFNNYRVNCFADDSGLEVETLNGAPGVYSARYAGEPKNDLKNIEKLLSELKGKNNRKARFKTVIALILNEKEYCFEGIVNGRITTEMTGTNGFGYDPVFIPDGYSQTFGQMSLSDKNSISHRAMAVKKLVEFLYKHQ